MRRRQSRSVALLYGGIAGALLVVVASVALIVAPPSPPSVAEFAPRADDLVHEAVDTQVGPSGGDPGAYCPSGAICDPDYPDLAGLRPDDPRLIERARVRRCVGSPPRQTEDPQSPPCVNYWDGDNGGLTTRGVTRDEIRVAYVWPWEMGAGERAIIDHFNRRYEFYGRQIRVVRVPTPPNNCDPAVQRAMAEKVAVELDPFASIEMCGTLGRPTFRNELARRGILSVGMDTGLVTEDFRSNRPFMWDYVPPLDEAQRNLAEMACNSLVGRPASHGGPDVSLSTRRFAVLRPTLEDRPLTIEPLRSGFARCGVELLVRDYHPQDRGAVLAELRASGATTLLPADTEWTALAIEATRLGYFPEWLLILGRGADRESALSQFPHQASQAFGLLPRNKLLPAQEDPFYWAIRESEQGFRSGDWLAESILSDFYRYLLVLSSGIQMAGPVLTPETFEQGLRAARFSNPSAGAPPLWQASVGFRAGSYAMIDDFALFWWSNSQERVRGSDEVSGSYCYIERGARWSLGRWPKGELPFFDISRQCR